MFPMMWLELDAYKADSFDVGPVYFELAYDRLELKSFIVVCGRTIHCPGSATRKRSRQRAVNYTMLTIPLETGFDYLVGFPHSRTHPLDMRRPSRPPKRPT
jgi:hypothetical protein